MARAAIRDKLDLQHAAQAFSSMMIVMGLAPILAPLLGSLILYYFNWQGIFWVLGAIGMVCFICVHFFFEETHSAEHRLRLSFKQVVLLYSTILQDRRFRVPMLAGCLTGAALFCYISSGAAVFMEQFYLEPHIFAYLFGLNAFGIILFSSLNKRLAKQLSVYQRLKIGGLIQVVASLSLLVLSWVEHPPLVFMMIGLFMAVAGIGFTGPNAMALAMADQGARAGTASAIMGSAQFTFGLLGGVVLNFLTGTPLMNMALLMFFFTGCGFIAITRLKTQLAPA